MLFKIMLWGLGVRMMWLSKHHAKFQEKIADKDMIFQFTTADKTASRFFVFQNNTVKSVAGVHSNAQITVCFINPAIASDIIIKSAKDQTVMMTAMQNKDVEITGDLGLMMWFMSIAKYLGPKKKSKPKA